MTATPTVGSPSYGPLEYDYTPISYPGAGSLIVVGTAKQYFGLAAPEISFYVTESVATPPDPGNPFTTTSFPPTYSRRFVHSAHSPTDLVLTVCYFRNPTTSQVWIGADVLISAGEYAATLIVGADDPDGDCQIGEALEQNLGASVDIVCPGFTVDTVYNRYVRVTAASGANQSTGHWADIIEVPGDNELITEGDIPSEDDGDAGQATATGTEVFGLTVAFAAAEDDVIPTSYIEVEPLRMGIPVPQEISVAGAVSGPVAFGPVATQPGTVIPDLVATVYRRPNLDDPIVVLDQSFNKSFLDKLNDTGSGTVEIDNDDPDLALIEDGDFIRFTVKGWAALTSIVRERTKMAIAGDEELGETTVLTGPGHLAVLDEAVIYPARGVGQLPIEEDRTFNWSAVDYDDSDWIHATEIALQSDTTQWWHDEDNIPFPAHGGVSTWPYPLSSWIWASTGDDGWAPEGTCYFRRELGIASDVHKIRIYLTCDDSASLYIDGQKLIDTDNNGNDPTEVIITDPIDVTEGTHVLAVRATNSPDPEGDTVHNPAGLLVAVYAVDATGSITDATPILTTDQSWLIVEYPPEPPGMTIGEILRHVIEEAQDRGGLVGLERKFSDLVDSHGEPWPETADVATKVNTDCLTFIKEIESTYLDLWMAPGSLELYAWNRGGRGDDQDVTFQAPTDEWDPNSGNLAQLQHHTVASPGNALLVRWTNGWIEKTDPTAIAADVRKEAALTIGAVQTSTEAERVAGRELEKFANPRTEITADLEPVDNTDTPYLAFRVGDTVMVPGVDDVSTRERVMAISVSEDEDGQLTFAPELKDVILAGWERQEQATRKMIAGTLGGQSSVATPVSGFVSPQPSCCPPDIPDGGGGG